MRSEVERGVIRDIASSKSGRALAVWLVAALACLGLAALFVRGQAAAEAARLAAEFARGGGAVRFAWCLAVYSLAGAAAINSPVPISAFLKIGGGFLFGAVAGSLANMVMNVLGAAIGFVAVRRAFRDRFAARFGKRLLAVDAELAAGGFWYVLSCRLALIFPFSAVNLACALSGVKFSDFMWASLAGSVPISVFYAVAGSELSRWTLEGVTPSPRMGALLGFLAVAALAVPLAARTQLGKKWLGRRAR
jgi:uncharacterized membrane protein YdjX (TVP38/TMEM64 family)